MNSRCNAAREWGAVVMGRQPTSFCCCPAYLICPPLQSRRSSSTYVGLPNNLGPEQTYHSTASLHPTIPLLSGLLRRDLPWLPAQYNAGSDQNDGANEVTILGLGEILAKLMPHLVITG